MTTSDLDDQIKEIYYKISTLNTEIDNINNLSVVFKTPENIINEYIDLKKNNEFHSNKKKKEVDRKVKEIEDNYKNIKNDIDKYSKKFIKENEVNELYKKMDILKSYYKSGIDKVLNLLNLGEFIEHNEDSDLSIKLSLKGKI